MHNIIFDFSSFSLVLLPAQDKVEFNNVFEEDDYDENLDYDDNYDGDDGRDYIDPRDDSDEGHSC
jgi:hypothetical protein